MRIIEQNMVGAIHSEKNWARDNTRVECDKLMMLGAERETRVFLHDNLIGQFIRSGAGDYMRASYLTLSGWNTRTTRSRLHAILVYLGYARNIAFVQRDYMPYVRMHDRLYPIGEDDWLAINGMGMIRIL